MTTITLIGDPNTWPFSRSRLAAGVREYGLPLVDHLQYETPSFSPIILI